MTANAAHVTSVTYDPQMRYPYRITCTCEAPFRGYVAEHAARAIAQDHEETAQ